MDMNLIALVLWICLWPVSIKIGKYFRAKTKLIEGNPVDDSKDVETMFSILCFIIWIAVALIIYNL